MNKFRLISQSKAHNHVRLLGIFRQEQPIQGKYLVGLFSDNKVEFEESEIKALSPLFSSRGEAAIFELGYLTACDRA